VQQRASLSLFYDRLVVGMEKLTEILIGASKFSGTHAKNAFRFCGSMLFSIEDIPVPCAHLRGVECHPLQLFALPEGGFSPLNFHKLPNLATDSRHGFEQLWIGFSDRTTKNRDDAC
jgi:hypothetical protein